MSLITAIPIFIAVIESGSFSQAAVRLGISKSAVSKRISGLESQLGVKLLHRSTRKLSLTEAGNSYYEYASQALCLAQEAEDAATKLQSVPKGRLRISCPMSFGILHIAPLIPKFLQQYPQIELHMDMSDSWTDIIKEGLDIALQAGELPDSSLIARKITPLKSVLCASKEYLERHGVPQKPGDLINHNCILYSYHSTINEWGFITNTEEEKVRISGNYQVNNSEALRESLVQGLGIGRLPTFIAGQHIKNGSLVAVLQEYKMPQKTLYAVFPERQYLPEKVRVFIDYLIDNFDRDKPSWDQW
jgi:DNA-binding transcriptional LysR family regulator